MDKFIKTLKEKNNFKNVDFQINRHFLVPYLQKENEEYEIELSFPFFLPLEAIEIDDDRHYVISTFVKDDNLRDVLNSYLNWLFKDIGKFKELFDGFDKLNDDLKRRVKSCGIDFEYMNEYYKMTTIKERLLLSKSVKVDKKFYLVFIDFLKEGDYKVKDGKFVLKGKGIKKRLFNYFEKMDIFDFLNDYFVISEMNYAYSIKGIKIRDFVVGRRKEVEIKENKFIPVVDKKFYKRVLIGSMSSYLAFESFKEVNNSIEDFTRLQSVNLEFLLNLYQDIEQLEDSKFKKLLKEAVMWQMKLISKNIIKD